MTSDFRAFAIAPKTIVPAGGQITAANITAAVQNISGGNANYKTPYIYACFGDVVLTTGKITHAVTVVGGQETFSGYTLKAGCILPIAKNTAVDLLGSANPAMILFFAT